jgi:hypothetical protein
VTIIFLVTKFAALCGMGAILLLVAATWDMVFQPGL